MVTLNRTVLAVMVLVAAALLNLVLLAEGQIVNGSQIQDIRLVKYGNDGDYQGRVEIMYNGQWGTICSSSWYTSEARVACRMLGFKDALCAVQSSDNYFGRPPSSTPILMNNVNCAGYESALDFCYFSGWGVSSYSCSSYYYYYGSYAGVVCLDEEDIRVPSDVKLIESSTTTLTIGWTAPAAPSWATSRRFTIRYQSDQDSYARTRTYYNSSFLNDTDVEMSYTITYLRRDTQYSIQVRADARHYACYYNYRYANYSDPVSFRTNATRRQSNIPVRLVSPTPGLDWLGRVEVFHNDQWGTVCDDYFYTTAANIVCQMLNYTQGAVCAVSSARLGRGQGPIWLDNVRCGAGDEVLEDCNHAPWGNTSCTHSEDVGVVCRPDSDNTYLAVQNLTALYVGPTSITVRWNRYTFPTGTRTNRFQLRYSSSYGYPRTMTIYTSSLTQYTLRYLQIGETYNITVRAYFYYPGCYSTIFGGYSNSVIATTVETAPTAPPSDFYVVAINRTAIEAEWDLPPVDNRGGTILGYKLFVQLANGGSEQLINITDNSTKYLVGGLQPATSYRLSVLAYTRVGDGPRSIHLIVPTLRFDPLITQFGYYGNGQDRITRTAYTYYYSSYYYGRVHIHCASNNYTFAPPQWLFANGSIIGVRDRNFHVGHYPGNGTAVLKIADNRPLRYCDGGIFTCRVNNTESGHWQERNFTLTINTSPPTPGRPLLIRAQSTSLTIGWSEALCNGGHTINSFNIRYRRSHGSSYYSYSYIRDIDPAQRNFTITGLQTNMYYSFSVQAVNLQVQSSSYSSSVSATTLPPAPTPPRDVTARLVAPLKVEVRWRPPAVTNGDISHYYVYAIPLRSAVSTNMSQTVQMAFPGSARAGNITLVAHSITYQFRVSAAVSFDRTYNEGDLSPVSANTSLFVPEPGCINCGGSVNPPTAAPAKGGVSGGEIGGIAVGAAVVLLLIILIVVIMLKKWRPKVIRRYGRHRTGKANDHDMYDDAPFIDDGGNEDNPTLSFSIDNKDD